MLNASIMSIPPLPPSVLAFKKGYFNYLSLLKMPASNGWMKLEVKNEFLSLFDTDYSNKPTTKRKNADRIFDHLIPLSIDS